MESELNNQAAMNTNQVTLELLGIEKKWIWAKNKGWIEMTNKRSTSLEITTEENEMNDSHSNKWWKFR